MNKQDFILALKKMNLECSEEKMKQLDILTKELIDYNKHTNLTRILKVEDIYLKHYYDSLTILNVINLNDINTLLDVGTGAGFPGLILKIFFPFLDITLLDSNNKKTKWLEYITKKLNINVKIVNERIENYARENLNSYDVVTSRAVANLRVLAELSLPLVKEHGYFIPLKGNISEELEESKDTIRAFNAIIEQINSFNLYGIRNILLIKKNRRTESNKIRTYDKILKKPLKKNN